MGGIDWAGSGDKDQFNGDVGGTTPKRSSGGDAGGVVDWAGKGDTDLLGGGTGLNTLPKADSGTPSIQGGDVVDFPGRGSSDTNYSDYWGNGLAVLEKEDMEEQYESSTAESTLGEAEQGIAQGQDVTPEQGQEAQQVQAQQPQGNAFDPKQFEYKYKGQAYTPKDRNHLVSLMSKGHSYETSMRILNEEKQKLEEMRQRYTPYERLDQFFQQNPQFRQEMMGLYQRYQQGQAQPQAGGQIPPEVQQKLQQLEQFQQQFREREANQALDQAVKDTKARYPQFDWETDDGEGNLERKVYQFMHESKIYDFEKGFRAYAFDMGLNNAQAQALQQSAQAQQQKRRAGVVDTGAPSVPASAPKPLNPSRATYNQLATLAKQEIGRG